MSANTWLAIAVAGYSLAAVLLVAAVILYFKLNILDVIGDLSGRTVARALKERQEEGGNAKNGRRRQRVSSLMVGGEKSGGSSSRKSAATGRRANLQPDKSAMSYAHESKRLDRKGSTGKTGAASGRTGRTGRQGAGGTAGFSSNMTGTGGRTTGSLSVDTSVLEEGSTNILSDYSTTAVLAANQTSVLIEETEKPVRRGTEPLPVQKTEILQGGTAVLSETEEAPPTGGTAVLQGGTAVLSETEEAPLTGGTSVLSQEEARQPIRFTVTRSYLVTHTEESID